MKLTINKDQLINGLQAVQGVAGSRTSMAVLFNVLLRADQNKLELTASDLDITISTVVEAKVEKAGATTVPAKKFFSIAREMPTQEIRIEVDDRNQCSISSGSSYFKIHGLSADEYPPMPVFSDEKKIVLPQEMIKNLFRKTAYAVSNDAGRFVLNGIFCSIKESKIVMVATDGRRLALAEENLEISQGMNTEFILPTKAISELSRLIQNTGQVEIINNLNQVSFVLIDENGGRTSLYTKLIEGTYPNYRQVIPSENKERIPIGREEFLQALKRAEIMTTDKSNSVKITFTKNNLSITSNAPEVGEGRESMAVNYQGNEISVAFNPGFLMDPLKALENDEVFLEITDELSPGVLKINGPFLYVIMPMRAQ